MSNNAFKILEEIFTNQITVTSIAVPTTPLNNNLAKEVCNINNYNIQLVQEPDNENFQVYVKNTDSIRSLYDSEVISDSTPILEVLDALSEKEQLFVKVKRNITHLVTRSDLDKIPVRIWLFGMISLFEIELKEKIAQYGINWETKLSTTRIENASRIYDLKKSRNEELDLLGCTQLVDIGTIVFKSWEQFKDSFLPVYSRENVVSSFKKINLLRDALAHGQKLQMKWPEIYYQIKLITYSLKLTSNTNNSHKRRLGDVK